MLEHPFPVPPDIPAGGEPLSEEIVRYRVDDCQWYLHVQSMLFHKGITKILSNDPMDEGLLRYVASQGGYEQYLANLDAAAERGAHVHKAIERLFQGETLQARDFPEEIVGHLASFLRFCANYKIETAALEAPVWDSRRQIATCIDWRGLLDGKHTTINWKTGKSIYETSKVQANEEMILFNDMGRFDELGPVQRWMVVRTNHRFPSKYQVAVGDRDERRHQYFETLYDVEAYHDEAWAPNFPKPLPQTFSLPPKKGRSNGTPGTESAQNRR